MCARQAFLVHVPRIQLDSTYCDINFRDPPEKEFVRYHGWRAEGVFRCGGAVCGLSSFVIGHLDREALIIGLCS
jgi:hypothetical protein